LESNLDEYNSYSNHGLFLKRLVHSSHKGGVGTVVLEGGGSNEEHTMMQDMRMRHGGEANRKAMTVSLRTITNTRDRCKTGTRIYKIKGRFHNLPIHQHTS